MHFPEKQLLSQDLDTEEASAWTTRWSIISIPRYIFNTSWDLLCEDLVQVSRRVPLTRTMMDAGRLVFFRRLQAERKRAVTLGCEVMCCHELRCHLAQAAYLWRLWERRRKTAVTLSEHAELQERSCGTGQRGETLMETAPTLKSPWTHFLSYSSTFTSKAPLRVSKQLFQITSSVQFPMNTSDRDRISAGGKL